MTYTVTLKTHRRADLTNSVGPLNLCIVHKCKPTILEIVAGRRKEHHYVATCKSEDCGKISVVSAEAVASIWNKWNPAQ